ncbi:glutamate receptor ionotropic, kainate 2-like isoform X2 [Arctopsyche grandis]|uniref:glutamate receptor ionotropic, kainate 2-like isoform X2 n=1 Tax=Arctopsyche grandis TaxID=121162 RepID=UPI00406D8DA1
MSNAVLILLSTFLILHGARAQEIKIGVLFDGEDDELTEWIFQTAVESYNKEREYFPDNDLVVVIEKIPRGDDFAATNAVCKLLEQGVIAIFGPSGESSQHVQSICDAMEIPHMVTKHDPNQEGLNSVINLHPHYSVMAQILVDIVNLFDWKVFTILYEKNENLPKLSELVKMHDGKIHIISMKQLDQSNEKNYREVFYDVKKSGDTRFIIDCSTEILYDVLIQAQQVGLMSDDHSYLITNLDLHTIDLEPFKYGGSNFTGMRLIDPEDPETIESVEYLNNLNRESSDSDDKITPYTLRTEAALMIDALYVFASGLKELDIVDEMLDEESFSCEEENGWKRGLSMVNYMRTVDVRGITGNIRFDRQSFRTDFQLDIIELTAEGIHKIGLWNVTEGLNISRTGTLKQIPALEGSLSNMSFTVITAISRPYGMLKDSSLTLVGNDRFEGFGIELIDEISKMLGFNYTFVLEPNGVYGSMDKKTGKWNGMIKELLEERADLAITDLTITAERQKAVDFTNPFMNLGISILYKAPTKQPPKLFSFMSPFSSEVWLFLGSAYMGVSILLFVVARMAPKEWQNPYPCIEEPEKLENQFSMPNSLWFTVGSVLQQGSELAPIAMSTRMIAGIWYFFTLIMVSSYTANLAAFLTVESLSSPISDAEELANNDVGIMYGSKKGGSTLGFFNDSSNEVYQKMAQYMTDHPEALTSSNDEGLMRVQMHNYAFLMESTSIEYITERNCDVSQVGGLLDNKGYGIAMRKNMYYNDALTKAVIKLQEQGMLHKMKDKWWKEKCGGGACSDDAKDSSSQELGLSNVGGVFVVLVGGCVLAIVTAAGEMIFNVAGRSRKHKIPFRKELVDELKFVAKCSGDTKPVRHRNVNRSSESGSGESESLKSKESKRSKSSPKSYGK